MKSDEHKYPRGKLVPEDEGELSIRMGIDRNTLIISFGKSIKWIGLGLQEVTEWRKAFEGYEAELRAEQGGV